MAKYKVKTEDLTDKVYKTIKQLILRGQLVPGQKLRQEEMAERMGVSRTPLLAAFSKLETDLMIESIPRRGFFVKQLSKKEELDMFAIRIQLEPLGAREAALCASASEKAKLLKMVDTFISGKESNRRDFNEYDYHFHSHIMDISQNFLLSKILSSFNLISLCNQQEPVDHIETSVNDHHKIALAIKESREEDAEEIMRLHIQRGIDRISQN